jgi:stage III sporulation protein AA
MKMEEKELVTEDNIVQFLSQELRSILKKLDQDVLKTVEEIRLRANKPLMIQNYHGDWFVDEFGNLTQVYRNLYMVKQVEILKTLELMSENSVYAFQEEIRNGFLTLKGGHRIGIAGRVVLDGNSIKNIKDISGLNIRLAREVPGCASRLIKYILKGRNDVYNTLIISPPQCGKTTMLRDIAKSISDGMDNLKFSGLKVGIVDERSEIAACYKGVPQNNVGVRTDVLDGCPKSLGMVMMIRSLSPQVIITDEIGSQGDKDAVVKVLNAGVKIITSAHGYNISELKSRQEVLSLLEAKIFERFVVLSNCDGPGTLEEVVDGLTMKVIYRRG